MLISRVENRDFHVGIVSYLFARMKKLRKEKIYNAIVSFISGLAVAAIVLFFFEFSNYVFFILLAISVILIFLLKVFFSINSLQNKYYTYYNIIVSKKCFFYKEHCNLIRTDAPNFITVNTENYQNVVMLCDEADIKEGDEVYIIESEIYDETFAVPCTKIDSENREYKKMVEELLKEDAENVKNGNVYKFEDSGAIDEKEQANETTTSES